MPDLDALYSTRLLEIAAAISRCDRLACPHATASAHSKLCGSRIEVDIALDHGRVTDFGQTVRACLLGQVSASVMAREIVGSKTSELRAIGAVMRRMLKENGPPPEGRWADLALLAPVRDYPQRHASTLLVFEAVEKALEETEMSVARGRA